MTKAMVVGMDSLCTTGSEKWGMCGLILKSDFREMEKTIWRKAKKTIQ